MTDQEDTRKRLLEAAGQRFAEKGYEATNVREITEAAGTSPAAVNYYFRSKEELYVEAVRHAAQSCDSVNPMPDWAPDVPAEQRLRDFIGMFLSRMLRGDVPDWHRHLIMREVGEPRHGACEEFVKGFVRPTFDALQAILRDLVPHEVSQEEVHLIGASIVGQCLHYHHARHIMPQLLGEAEYAALAIDRIRDHIWRFSLAAVRGLYSNHDNPEQRTKS